MNPRLRILITLSSVAAVTIGLAMADVFWLIPKLQHLRTAVDNDRATTTLILQQQSNLAQLLKDLDSIQTKQAELNTSIWTFLTEDSFFTAVTNIGQAHAVTIDQPSISDATPTGALLNRAVTIVIHGQIDSTLGAVSAVQALTPLVAIQKITVGSDSTPGNVTVTLNASTLWK